MDKIDNSFNSIYNSKSLYLLNIKELRSLGRQLGMPSPASKSKAQLVDYILKIVYGEVDVPVKTKFGRPSTNNYNIEDCLNKIRENSPDTNIITNNIKRFKYEDEYKEFGVKLVSSKADNYKLDDFIETRFFCEVENKFFLRKKCFVESEDDIQISKMFVNNYNLVNMDIVEIVKCNKFFKIYSINGVKVKKDTSINIGSNVIYWGRNQDFYLSTKDEIKEWINSLSNWCEDKNVKLMIFGDKKYLGDGIFSMNYDQNADYSQFYKSLMLFIEKCESYSTSGEEIIVIFEDKLKINSLIQSFDDDISGRIKKHLQEVLKNIVDVGNICVSLFLQEDMEY